MQYRDSSLLSSEDGKSFRQWRNLMSNDALGIYRIQRRGEALPVERQSFRLMYEPDDYLCTWNLPDGKEGRVDLPGNLDVRPNRQPRGFVYGSVPIRFDKQKSGEVAASFPQRVNVPVLPGTLENGGSVLLFDASIDYWSPDRGLVSGVQHSWGKGTPSQGGQGHLHLRRARNRHSSRPLLSKSLV